MLEQTQLFPQTWSRSVGRIAPPQLTPLPLPHSHSTLTLRFESPHLSPYLQISKFSLLFSPSIRYLCSLKPSNPADQHPPAELLCLEQLHFSFQIRKAYPSILSQFQVKLTSNPSALIWILSRSTSLPITKTKSAKKMITYFSPLIPKIPRSNTSLTSKPSPTRWSTTSMAILFGRVTGRNRIRLQRQSRRLPWRASYHFLRWRFLKWWPWLRAECYLWPVLQIRRYSSVWSWQGLWRCSSL